MVLLPGKKLLFMGCEIGQTPEWNANGEIEWWLLNAGPYHRGVQRMMEDSTEFIVKTQVSLKATTITKVFTGSIAAIRKIA